MSRKAKKNVPQLRFSQFQDDWFFGTLRDCIKQLDAGVSVNSDSQESIENEKGVLKTSCVSMGEFEPSENKLVSDEYERTRLRESVKKDTIIICRSNTPTFVGASAYIDKDYPNLFLSDKLWAAKIKKKFSSKWVSYLLLQGKNRTLLCLRATGTSNSMKNISKDDLLTLPAYFPTQEEQEKIASFLGAVDTRLTQLHRKHELLQTYKRGVMQKLFSQEIRFKRDDGKVFPNWNEKKLEEIFKESRIKGSKGDMAKKLTVKLWGKGVFSKDGEGSENTQYFIRKSGQFIYSKLDFLNCAFGIIPDELDGFESTVDLPCFDIAEGYSSIFLLKRVMQKDFYKYFGDQADGSRKAKRIHADIFLGFTMNCPCFEEQEKIADFLKVIDQKIETIAQKIDLTEQYKKGLLQKMFV